MTLTEMKRALDAERIRLTKSLGQNFLHDQNQLDKIVRAAQLQPEDCVLEIGSGLGPLTERLAAQSRRVLAIEKDARLAEFLRSRHFGKPPFELIQGDALEFLERAPAGWSDWKVVSNLPYSAASPMLIALARKPARPKRIVATVQWEVAQRLTAAPGGKNYGVLTLLIQLRYAVAGSFKIPASCFFPAPEVDSACVTLERREPALLPIASEELFDALVKRSFAQRRKMMLKLLKESAAANSAELAGLDLARLLEAWRELGLPEQVRAESLSLGQFVQLTRLLWL